MLRTQNGKRVLTEAEWQLLAVGIAALWDRVEQDIFTERDDARVGIAVFDRLTAEQKLGLIAEVAVALRRPAVAAPDRTAAIEGTISAVFETLLELLDDEIGIHDQDHTKIRQLILAAAGENSGEFDAPLPSPTCPKPDDWGGLMAAIACRISLNDDFDMEAEIIDLSPRQSSARMKMLGIDRNYFLYTPPEPNLQALCKARRTLRHLLSVPVLN